MRLVIISDTHNKHAGLKLPEGDVLVHCGDSTKDGTFKEWAVFCNWLQAQPFEKKVVIFGNHELFTERREKTLAVALLKSTGAILLDDSATEINGKLFYGSSWTPRYHNWAYNANRGQDIAKHWRKIPNETQILITHGPPAGILDNTIRAGGQGCYDLLQRTMDLKHLELHCFGHLHLQNSSLLELNGVKFVNAACLNDRYELVGNGMVVDL